MSCEKDTSCTSREDSKWVPKEKYEQMLEKMNAIVMENNALIAENKRLKNMDRTDYKKEGLGIGR